MGKVRRVSKHPRRDLSLVAEIKEEFRDARIPPEQEEGDTKDPDFGDERFMDRNLPTDADLTDAFGERIGPFGESAAFQFDRTDDEEVLQPDHAAEIRGILAMRAGPAREEALAEWIAEFLDMRGSLTAAERAIFLEAFVQANRPLQRRRK